MRWFLSWLLAGLAVLQAGAQPASRFSLFPDYGRDTGADRNSGLNNLLADSGGIYVGGAATDQDPVFRSQSLLARYDYKGTLVWRRDVRTPFFVNNLIGSNNLISLAPGRKAIVGTNYDNTLKDSTVAYQPFIYFFSDNGDSLRYVPQDAASLEDRIVYAAARGSGGSILATGTWGSASRYRRCGPSGCGYIPDTFGIYVVKYDPAGNRLWEAVLSKRSSQQYASPVATKILEAPDGSLYLAFYDYDAAAQRMTGNLAKLDATGNLVWRRTLPAISHDIFYTKWDIAPAPDGGFYFLMPGTTEPFTPFQPPGNYLFYYGRCNSDGDTLWTRFYADTGQVNGYKETHPVRLSIGPGGNLLLLGTFYQDGDYRPLLVVTDSGGAVRYRRAYFPYPARPAATMLRSLNACAATPYGTLVFAGSVTSGQKVPQAFDSAGTFGWLLQTDAFGCETVGCEAGDTVWHPTPPVAGSWQDASPYRLVALFPNPAGRLARLRALPAGASAYVLRDITGRGLQTGVFRGPDAMLDLGDLPAGLYLLALRHLAGGQTVLKVRKE